MIHENQEYNYPIRNTLRILGGMLIGGLAGAVTMLLLAPQSGKDTRKRIQEKGVELRDRTTETVEDTMAKVRTKADAIGMELMEHGQDLAVEQLENVSKAAKAGKKAIQNS